MFIAISIRDLLNRILPEGFRIVPIYDGVSVHADRPVCGSKRIADLWRDPEGKWHWRSLYLGDQPSGNGTLFEGFMAVQEATSSAVNAR